MIDVDKMAKTEFGMSNFDQSIDDGLAEELMSRPNAVRAQHSAWNFCGFVWHDGKKFREQVWVYRSLVAEYSADDLRGLMEIVNNKHGWD